MADQRKHPLSFDAEAARAGVSSRMPLGVRPIRLKRIVGSAGKAEKLGLNFLPLGSGPAAGHYRTIHRLMKEGNDLPPITVYQIGPRYFVVDGHTRVAAAKALGMEFIDANVTDALPRKEGEANLNYYARREFERATGLEGIRLTAPWRYHLLQHHVEGYRLYLERSRGREVSLPEAARVWYRTQYEPTLQAIHERRLTSLTGGHTAGDVYTDLLKSWAEEEGLTASLREMLDRYENRWNESQGRLKRATRAVTRAVDAALPKAVPPLERGRSSRFVDRDVDADLEAAEEEGS